MFFVFGAHAFMWGTTSITVRQRAVPTELQGRVGSVNMVCVCGGLVIGSVHRRVPGAALGRDRAVLVRLRRLGAVLVLMWRELGHIAHADEQNAHAPAETSRVPDPALERA